MKFVSKKITSSILALTAGSLLASNVFAQTATRVTVRVENVAPSFAAFQTPVWVGLHDGTFDTYDGNTRADNDPRLPSAPDQPILNEFGQSPMEALCEDGSTTEIAQAFADIVPTGIDTSIQGPNGGPLAPGEINEFTFTVNDPSAIDNRFFSYASMLIPSNDFCVSNGNPRRHPLFDEQGNFIGESFFVTGQEMLDAGTELNDELPENTAFFGQTVRNSGVDTEGLASVDVTDQIDANGNRVTLQVPGLMGTIGSDINAPDGFTFRAPNPNDNETTILEDPRFVESDFRQTGYSVLKFTFSAEPAPTITEELDFRTILKGNNEVPAVRTRAIGITKASLLESGTLLEVLTAIIRLPKRTDITMAHLHLGQEGENGPVIADLLGNGSESSSRRIRRIASALESDDLVGPLQGQTLSRLVEEIQAGNVYVNIHTDRNPAGEIRGQLKQQY